MHVLKPMPLPPSPEHLDEFVRTLDTYRMHSHIVLAAHYMLDGLIEEYELRQTESVYDTDVWNDIIDNVRSTKELIRALAADTVASQLLPCEP